MTRPGESPTDAAALPREVGGFRLLRVLGRGGMGVVYEAEELASGRRVALKVLVRELTLSGEAFERFRREARIAASVSDSSCVFVFGAHVIEGSPAIAMELCEGETLEHRIASGKPVPVEDAVRWTIEILDGLEAAHRAGVVHRDVKPSNCFTTAQGRVKVGDFGLSRSLDTEVQLTRSGVFLGSPLYASPEQVRGRQVDLRSDLYSVGATLYALLTGRSPYHGENIGEVLARILSETPPPPSALRPEVPRGLDKVVLRAMSRDPEERYESHAAMREALSGFLVREREAASPLRRLLAYMADQWLSGIFHIPLVTIWTRFDPLASQQLTNQPWRLRSASLMLVMTFLSWLYFAVAEGLFGRTVGKWITGQRVVAVGEAGPVPPAVLRSLVWFTPAFVATLLGFSVRDASEWVGTAVETGIPTVGMIAMLSTMRRRNGWRGLHEKLSGTRVVRQPLPFARFVRHKAPPASRLEPSDRLPAQLGVYATVGRVGRTASGEIFEANDTHLDRRVWIHARDPALPPISPERRSLDRATRLRWLDAFEVHGVRHEVFEAPGGARLVDCCAGEGRLPWPMAHGILASLAEEVDRSPAPRLSLEQVWIDRSWSLRILDEPLAEGDPPAHAPLEILGLAARTSLGLPRSGEVRLPADLPLHAENAARRLLGLEEAFATVAEARSSLAETAGRPQGLDGKVRGLQILLGAGVWTFFSLLVVVGPPIFVLPQAREMAHSLAAIEELRAGRTMTADDMRAEHPTPTGAALDAEDLRARSIVVAQVQPRVKQFGQGLSLKLSPEQALVHAQAKAKHGAAAPVEIEAARARIAAEREPGFGEESPFVRILRRTVFVLPFYCVLVWTLASVVTTFLTRGGASLLLASLAVRDTKGRRAGRFRCAFRAFAAGLPFLLVWAPSYALAMSGHLVGAWIALSASGVLHLLLIAATLRSPARGWHDRVAGTRLVPR